MFLAVAGVTANATNSSSHQMPPVHHMNKWMLFEMHLIIDHMERHAIAMLERSKHMPWH